MGCSVSLVSKSSTTKPLHQQEYAAAADASNNTAYASLTDVQARSSNQTVAQAVMAGALDVSDNQMSTTHFSEVDTVRNVISRGSWGSSRVPEDSSNEAVSIVILGGFTEIAFKKVIPCLLRLYETGLLKENSNFIALSSETSTNEEYREKCKQNLHLSNEMKIFLSKLFYMKTDLTSSAELNKITEIVSSGRVAYFFCLPEKISLIKVFSAVLECIHTTAWVRMILDGNDSQTYDVKVQQMLGSNEEYIYRIDPFAGSDVMRRLIALRFGNRVLEPMWNRNHIKAVLIDFALDETDSRKYSNKFFLRDVFVDHLLSLVALVAMERPSSRFGDDVRDVKTDVLSAVQTIRPDRFVLGRTETDEDNSITFATVVLEIDTNRWRGVPFVLRCGKGMARTKSEVRILFRPVAGSDALWRDQGDALEQNELTLHVLPSENAHLDLISNLPGLDTRLTHHVATLDYLSKAAPYVPEPYERLIYDVVRGRKAKFVRKDALLQASRIMEPIFQQNNQSSVEKYSKYSKFGPNSSDELIQRIVGTTPWINVERKNLEIWSKVIDFKLTRELVLSFRINFDLMRLLVRSFSLEMDKGMKRDPTSTVKMLESYVTKLPNGLEDGEFLGLDFGGTNFRVVKFLLAKNQPPIKIQEMTYKIPDQCRTGTSDDLFDFLADCIAPILGNNNGGISNLGFTFSFPTKQITLSTGTLITWTKGWKTEGVLNSEISTLLHRSLDKKGIKARVIALVNDTVGTLAAKHVEDPQVKIGVILGTGTNAAFVEKDQTGSFTVISTEWGGFGSFGRISALPFTPVDAEIDRESPAPGEQWFEKMTSGYYLGEISRKWLVLLKESGELWKNATIDESTSPLYKRFAFDSKLTHDVELDLSDDLQKIQKIEKEQFQVIGSALKDRILVREVCRTVVERSARLTACALAAIVNRINEPGIVAGVDGSLFEAHISFKQRLVRALDSLGCDCSLVLSKDGSGLGAALIAAAASRATQ